MKYLFLDESGSHNLAVRDPQYPVFVLGGVIVADAETLAEIESDVVRNSTASCVSLGVR